MVRADEAGAVMATGFFSGWSGFIMGAAVGVIVGLLLAPKSGRETREMLGERIGEVRDRVRRSRSDGEEAHQSLYSPGGE